RRGLQINVHYIRRNLMSNSLSANGTARKSLAQQIDRLDSILDGLADALNEAVATAVKEAVGLAVKEAVRGVLVELLGNPDVLRQLAATVAQPTAAEMPTALAPKIRLRERACRMSRWIGGAVHAFGRCCAAKARQVYGRLVAGWVRLWALRRCKYQLL